MNRFLSILQAVLQFIGSFGGSPTPTPTPPGPKPPTPPEDNGPIPAWQAETFRLHNEFRASDGVKPLRLDTRLNAAAQKFAEVMAKMQKMSHEADGTHFVQRCKAEGYPYPTGENIAMGYPSPAAVCDGWEHSRGHRTNMLNPNSTTIGIGRAVDSRGYLYWCVNFGGGTGVMESAHPDYYAERTPDGLCCPGYEA